MTSNTEFNRAKNLEGGQKALEQARKWTEQEIAESGFAPDSPEAVFHRRMAAAFGTMTVAPLEKKPIALELKKG